MTFTIKEVIEKLKDEKEISISLIQREMPTGFIQAGRLFKELQDNQYVVNMNNKYKFNKKKISDELGITFRTSVKLDLPEPFGAYIRAIPPVVVFLVN